MAHHSHVDVGFTDFQDVTFRQHAEHLRAALDLVEATADHPPEARFRWTCEVTGPLMRALRTFSPAELERLRHWQREGAIDIAALEYNFTPLLNVEQLCRSLYAVRELREGYGLEVSTAMQGDVNGVAWLLADLLPAIGVGFLTMAINEVCGRAPQPYPGAFWWEGPAGGRLLVWNGLKYSFIRLTARLGDWRHVHAALPPLLERIGASPGYRHDFLYCQATAPRCTDNTAPDVRLAEFVREWNEQGHVPRIELTTPTAFGRVLTERVAGELPVRRGDWTDWWANGVASSAFETGVARAAGEHLLMAETLGSWLAAAGAAGWDAERVAEAYAQASLFCEHSWGASASIRAPDALLVRAQWARKATYAHAAAFEAHDVLARAAHALVEGRATHDVEGTLSYPDGLPEPPDPDRPRELMVVNTLPWPRSLLVDEPVARVGGPPLGVLEAFDDGAPPATPATGVAAPERARGRAAVEVPALGFAFVAPRRSLGPTDVGAGETWIENAHYRVEVDPATGAIASWHDKDLDRELAGAHLGWRPGQVVHELLDDPAGRDAIFAVDNASPSSGTWAPDPPFVRTTVTAARVRAAGAADGRAEVVVDVEAPGLRGARCRWALEAGSRVLALDWELDKVHVTEPESLYVAFPFALGAAPVFRLDLGGVPCAPELDQLPGATRDWYCVRRWVDVSDEEVGVTVAPLDAPLVQLGSITTARAAHVLHALEPVVMSLALNNHWRTNFRASQGGRIPLRYRLAAHAGPCVDADAARFGAEQATPPLVLRAYGRRGPDRGQFAALAPDAGVELTAKPAEDGDGVILRLLDLGGPPRELAVELAAPLASACLTSPLEVDGDPLAVRGRAVSVPVGPRRLVTVRVRFGAP